tara:strand:+ start:3035 stop:3238 length:204 start_codon:yes stop_codon:yes gene_type:complete
MRDVYISVYNSGVNQWQGFVLPSEALVTVRFCGLTTLLAAKYLANRMEIVDEGQVLLISRVSVSTED